jgi:hypothetical protein
MVTGDFSELWDSDYYVLDEKTKEYILLDGAPPEIVELFKKEKEIEAEEKRTGKHIF